MNCTLIWEVGLMYCCLNDKAAIRVVVDCLRIPSLETRVRLSVCVPTQLLIDLYRKSSSTCSSTS